MSKIGLSVFICLWCSALANNMSASTTARTTFQSSSPSIAAPVTTKSNGTRTTVAPTSIPAITCSQRNASCGDCIQDINCFWCGADDTCKDYQATSNLIPDCKGNNWYWKECFVAGNIFMFKLYISLKLR